MIRINLLPPYIFDKRKKVQVGALWLAGVLAIVVAFVMWNGQVSSTLQKAQSDQQNAHALQNQWTQLDNEIKQTNQAAAATKAKQDFVANAVEYNDAWPSVYDMMRDMTSSRVVLRSMSLDPGTHQSIGFAGFAPTEMDVMRWWIVLRNDTDEFQRVTFNIPQHGYPPAGGAPGAGGGGGASPGAFGGGAVGGKFGALAGLGGGPGGGGGTGGGGPDVGPTVLEGRPGLDFTGAVVLKTAMAGGMGAPGWPPGAGGGGAMGGATGGGMGMGGMTGKGRPNMTNLGGPGAGVTGPGGVTVQ